MTVPLQTLPGESPGAQDVHARFRTEAHQDVVPRFNERFLLSLGGCESCIVLDDELNLLPLSRHCKMLEPLEHAPKDVRKLVRLVIS